MLLVDFSSVFIGPGYTSYSVSLVPAMLNVMLLLAGTNQTLASKTEKVARYYKVSKQRSYVCLYLEDRACQLRRT